MKVSPYNIWKAKGIPNALSDYKYSKNKFNTPNKKKRISVFNICSPDKVSIYKNLRLYP